MRLRILIPAAVVVGLCIAGCHHQVPQAVAPRVTPPPARAAEPPPPPAPPARARAAAPSAPLSDDELFRRKSLEQLNAEHPLGDVFFDYQKDVIRDDGRTVLEQDVAWLKRYPQTKISIDGHCDERGTAEYNLALGDRRAEAVRQYLVGLGVDSNRLMVRTFGKEAPFCNGDGEGCWSQNRRDHFIIVAK
jgi:peptidoglycan-associated lipoprotein